jgi:hypothetical protein
VVVDVITNTRVASDFQGELFGFVTFSVGLLMSKPAQVDYVKAGLAFACSFYISKVAL